MSGLTDEGWCSGRQREHRKQTGSAPGIAAVSFSPSPLSRVCSPCLGVGCSPMFTWAVSSPENRTDAQEPDLYPGITFSGGEVMRSGSLAKRPGSHLSPPNPGHVQPPVDSPGCTEDGEANAARCDADHNLLTAIPLYQRTAQCLPLNISEVTRG